MNLQTSWRRPPAPDFLREMTGFTAQRLMALEGESLTGATPGARSPDRLDHRNGYPDRDWTRAVTVELRIPKLRNGSRATCKIIGTGSGISIPDLQTGDRRLGDAVRSPTTSGGAQRVFGHLRPVGTSPPAALRARWRRGPCFAVM